MLRSDGTYRIYRIQHRKLNSDRWIYSDLDVFGWPNGFAADTDSKCWNETGVCGTYDKRLADDGLLWIAAENPGVTFRLVEVMISQRTIDHDEYVVMRAS